MVTKEEHQEVLDTFKSWGRRATIGFVIGLVGVGFALFESNKSHNEALTASKDKASIVRSVLCKQLTSGDVQLYVYVAEHPKGSGGFSEILTPQLVEESLKRTANERSELNYDPKPQPPGVCSPKVTPKPPAKAK